MGFHESLSCFAEALSAVEGDDTSHAVPAEKHCVEPEESSQKSRAKRKVPSPTGLGWLFHAYPALPFRAFLPVPSALAHASGNSNVFGEFDTVRLPCRLCPQYHQQCRRHGM